MDGGDVGGFDGYGTCGECLSRCAGVEGGCDAMRLWREMGGESEEGKGSIVEVGGRAFVRSSLSRGARRCGG